MKFQKCWNGHSHISTFAAHVLKWWSHFSMCHLIISAQFSSWGNHGEFKVQEWLVKSIQHWCWNCQDGSAHSGHSNATQIPIHSKKFVSFSSTLRVPSRPDLFTVLSNSPWWSWKALNEMVCTKITCPFRTSAKNWWPFLKVQFETPPYKPFCWYNLCENQTIFISQKRWQDFGDQFRWASRGQN